jgi:hypothetical protein
MVSTKDYSVQKNGVEDVDNVKGAVKSRTTFTRLILCL